MSVKFGEGTIYNISPDTTGVVETKSLCAPIGGPFLRSATVLRMSLFTISPTVPVVLDISMNVLSGFNLNLNMFNLAFLARKSHQLSW